LKSINNSLGVVFGLALLAALLAGGYFLFRYIVGVFSTLEPQIAKVTAIASVVALLCATIISSGLRSHDHETTRVEKAQLYRQLLSISSRWNPSERENNRETELEHLELKQRLALWGSPGVIATYAELERHMKQEKSQDDGAKPLLKKLVNEMRKDLGQTTSNFSASLAEIFD
jgi:hypothetical protein